MTAHREQPRLDPDRLVRCPSCTETKPETAFYPNKNRTGPRKITAYCRSCMNAKRAQWAKENPTKADKIRVKARRRYKFAKCGLTEEQGLMLLALHAGRCQCCGTSDPGSRGWSVDHDHLTGMARGIVCQYCNVRIGQLGDTMEGIRHNAEMFIRYLSTVPERMAAAGLSSLEPPKPRTFKPSPVVITEEPADLHAGLWC